MAKKIIGTHVYDTRTASLLITKWTDIMSEVDPEADPEAEPEKLGYYKQSLYLKNNGKFFLYNVDTVKDEWEIVPIRNTKKARDWCIQNFDADKVERIFGPIPE